MKIPESIISQIQDNLDIVDVISDYTQVQKKGGRYWAICPFHSEKTPSFSITPEKGVFYCFGCHKGGTVYNFIMEAEKLNFVEAVKFLAPRAGVELNVQVDQKQLSQQEALRDLYDRLGKAFHHILLTNGAAAPARAYLAKRGIPKEMIELFQIGYIPGDRNWLKNFLLKKNYSPEFLFQSGLFSQKYTSLYPIFTNRVMFPILDRQGRTIAFGGRALDDNGPKYINSPETAIFKKKNNLFGWYQALDSMKKEESFYLVEGYFDVIALHMAGVKNAMAPLGTAFTLEQARLLNRYVKKGFLLFDNDKAGQKATERTIEILQQTQVEINIISLEKEKDPADILLHEGKEELQKLLKYSINYFQYLIKRAVKHYNPDTAEGKEKIFQFLFPYVENLDSQIKLDGYLNTIADTIGVNYKAVRSDFQNRKTRKKPQSIVEVKIEHPIIPTDELSLMLALAVNSGLYAKHRNQLSPGLLEDPNAKELYFSLEECFREDNYSKDYFLGLIERHQLKELLIEKFSTGEYTINTDDFITKGIYKLKKREIMKRQDQISMLIKRFEKADPGRTKDLMVEKMILDKELQKLRVGDNV